MPPSDDTGIVRSFGCHDVKAGPLCAAKLPAILWICWRMGYLTHSVTLFLVIDFAIMLLFNNHITLLRGLPWMVRSLQPALLPLRLRPLPLFTCCNSMRMLG